MQPTKAITIKNPWAWLIANGIKDIENRTWRTKFRGTVLIHSAATWYQGFNYHKQLNSRQINMTVEQWDYLSMDLRSQIISKDNIPTSAIIGQVDIVDCVQGHPSVWAIENHWHWVLENAVYFDKPITGIKGKLSFWEVPENFKELLPNIGKNT